MSSIYLQKIRPPGHVTPKVYLKHTNKGIGQRGAMTVRDAVRVPGGEGEAVTWILNANDLINDANANIDNFIRNINQRKM